ncbi:MAG: eCIS core domain-containing protein [Jatrophihabitans sp.]
MPFYDDGPALFGMPASPDRPRQRPVDPLLGLLAAELLAGCGAGQPLSAELLAWLEGCLATDLSAVRVHTGPQAQRWTALLGAQAATTGCDIYFAAGAFQPATATGRFLLAHEVAHVVQQAAGTLPAAPFRGRPGDRFERAADEIATRAIAGIALAPAARGVPVRRDPSAPLVIQCHDSFEHRALGDLPTADLRTISDNGGRRTEIIQRQIQLLWLWSQNPESVTEQQINQLCPWIRTIRLAASGLLVTYGELNALPDYIATADTADTIGKQVLLPILQFIRQEGYIQFNKLLGRTVSDHFQDSVFTPSQYLPGLVNTLLGSQALDELTSRLGYQGTGHYSGLLARNACHFAPFAWYRWQSSYLIARDLALKAFQAVDPNVKAALTHEAWTRIGYADHFLQDSFAAGHLVNKSLIMQWFIEWAAGQSLVQVVDWDIVKLMTTRLQPGLAGRQLYGLDYPGPSNDPQTSEDLATYDARRANTGVVVGESGSLSTGYQDYWTLMSNLITQSASASIHDYYNANSLWVASVAHPAAYEVWGDDTLLSGSNGGEGVQQTSGTSQLSQQSISDLLRTGRTEIAPSQIRANFPTQVVDSTGRLIALEQWNNGQRGFCGQKIFPDLHDIVVRILSPRIANVSRDQDLATRWSSSLPGCGYHVTSVLESGGRVFTGCNGYVYELDPGTGAIRHSMRVSDTVGVGDYETRLSTNGNILFVGVHGYVYGINLANWTKAWERGLPSAGYLVVELAYGGGRLYACSNGYLYLLDPASGAVQHSLLLGSRFGTGDYTARLCVVGDAVLIGMHGYAYLVRAAQFSAAAWECSLPNAGYDKVDVLVLGDRVYAGSSGYAYEIGLNTGRVQQALRVSGPVGVGDYTTTLVAGDAALYVGCHGYVYAIPYGNWSRPAWAANLAGDRYSPANLVSYGGRLVAGSYGYLYRIDPAGGRVLRSTLLTSALGVGDYQVRLVASPQSESLYVGVHGYGYQVASVQH